ncbi:Ctr domain-containing protein [Rhizoctonia solani AG-1 IA]|uniref:Ctr domain-containing protein n=1 Tax=Thanatephorus cucumeris (strain AG1-IA) TaxID=983506 RepID=L8WN98_THACA|nr:Ctr domain-containing protein [Rhizoctonia solani AG-1 IA]
MDTHDSYCGTHAQAMRSAWLHASAPDARLRFEHHRVPIGNIGTANPRRRCQPLVSSAITGACCKRQINILGIHIFTYTPSRSSSSFAPQSFDMEKHAAPTQSIIQNDVVTGTIFHTKFDGSAFIFPSLRITSWPTFAAACFITSAICLSERYLTYLISTKRTPFQSHRPAAIALFRSAMYWVNIHAYCNVIPPGVRIIELIVGADRSDISSRLILATVTSLSIGQFFIELQEAKSSTTATESYHPLRDSVDLDNEPYTDPPTSLFPFTPSSRAGQSEVTQIRAPITETGISQSSLLTPHYRAPPRKVVAFEVSANTDIGTGNGRERAREIMGRG